MADLASAALPDEKPSPSHDDLLAGAGGGNALDARGIKRARGSEEDDDDDDKPGRERRKIEIKFIQDKSRRHITFSKRKSGIMKKVRFPPPHHSNSNWNWNSTRLIPFSKPKLA